MTPVHAAEIWVGPQPWSMKPVKVDQPDKEVIVLSLDDFNTQDRAVIHNQIFIDGIPVKFKNMQEVSNAVWEQLERERKTRHA